MEGFFRIQFSIMPKPAENSTTDFHPSPNWAILANSPNICHCCGWDTDGRAHPRPPYCIDFSCHYYGITTGDVWCRPESFWARGCVSVFSVLEVGVRTGWNVSFLSQDHGGENCQSHETQLHASPSESHQVGAVSLHS